MKIVKKIIMILILFVTLNVSAEGEATINNIKVNGKDATCTGYDCVIEVDAEKATVTYSLIDSDATVDRLSGFTVDLTSPTNLIKIVVKNDKGEEKIENTYNITINKHEKSNDYTLSSLKVGEDEIKLSDDVFVYNYTAKYDVETITLTAKTKDSKAKILTDLNFDFPLDRSSIALDFNIQAENGDTKTYRLVVARGIKPNTYLKTLKIDKIDIKFDKEKLNYEETVEYSVNEVMIEAEAEDEKAKVDIIKPETLEVGENIIKIKVSQEKAESIYEIKVKREPNLDKSLANLKTLEIEEYPKLDFEPNVLDYTLKFREIPSQLTIKALPENSEGKVEIINNKDLEDKDKVVIKVTLEQEEYEIVREYTLNIIESKSIVSSKLSIIISIIVLVITMIILFILQMKEKRKMKFANINKIKNLIKKKNNKKKIEKEKEEEIEII